MIHFNKIIASDHSPTTIIIRLMVGLIFLTEGIQKFIFPAIRGAGRFQTIGLPWPDILGPVVGSFEIIAGVMITIGLYTRIASGITLGIMLVSLITTKYVIAINSGFWVMAHATRTDYAMALGSIYLIIKGSGLYGVDKRLSE